MACQGGLKLKLAIYVFGHQTVLKHVFGCVQLICDWGCLVLTTKRLQTPLPTFALKWVWDGTLESCVIFSIEGNI